MCTGNTKKLYKLKKEIFGYRFTDEPDYHRLRVMLSDLLFEAQIKAIDANKYSKCKLDDLD